MSPKWCSLTPGTSGPRVATWSLADAGAMPTSRRLGAPCSRTRWRRSPVRPRSRPSCKPAKRRAHQRGRRTKRGNVSPRACCILRHDFAVGFSLQKTPKWTIKKAGSFADAPPSPAGKVFFMKRFNTSSLTSRERRRHAAVGGLLIAFATQASALSTYSCFNYAVSPDARCRGPRLSMPYLASLGVVPLRFAPAPEPATPRPALPAPEATAAAPVAPATSTTPSPATPVETSKTDKSKSAADTPAPPTPVSILPDDTPRDVHAEDVLPYFQMPKGGAANVPLPFTPAAPAPKSSATYELK